MKIEKELKTFNFADAKDLDTRNGVFLIDIAVWLKLEQAKRVKSGRIYLKYVSGLKQKFIKLDSLVPPATPTALLATKIRVPLELKDQTFTLCAEVTGSEFKVDTVHVQAQKKPVDVQQSKILYAA